MAAFWSILGILGVLLSDNLKSSLMQIYTDFIFTKKTETINIMIWNIKGFESSHQLKHKIEYQLLFRLGSLYFNVDISSEWIQIQSIIFWFN